MRTVISQSVVLPAPAEGLFAMYTDPAKPAVITGAPVAISVEPGSPFQAFNGALTGATSCKTKPRQRGMPGLLGFATRVRGDIANPTCGIISEVLRQPFRSTLDRPIRV